MTVGIVGGSDYKKITEQLGACSDVPIEKMFKYVFSENGLVAFKDGAKLAETSFIEKIGEEKYQVKLYTAIFSEIFGVPR